MLFQAVPFSQARSKQALITFLKKYVHTRRENIVGVEHCQIREDIN